MNLVGELVLARNQILQHANTHEDATLLGTSQRLNLITTELQEGVMKTRMQPIGNVWNKFPRVVRDLALACGKQVRVELEGSETELDRTIIEAIKDPLTHLVRNAVDHGIELPAERLRRGKPATGCLRTARLSRERAGQHRDLRRRRGHRRRAGHQQRPGTGTDLPRAGRADGRPRADAVDLPPGLQHGRAGHQRLGPRRRHGRGQDQHREDRRHDRHAERAGPGDDPEDQDPPDPGDHPGPDRQRRRRPLRDPAGQPAGTGAAGRGAGQARHRDDPRSADLPAAGKPAASAVPESAARSTPPRPPGRLAGRLRHDQESARSNIVVLQADGRRFGLVVDGINDTEEIVVKPLGKQLKGVSLFAGATIMGDGRVGLILDVAGIAQRAGVVSADGRSGWPAKRQPTDQGRKDERSAYLLLRHGADGRVAIPLSLVARLEEIPCSAIEHSGGREVVQYRNQIMPLVVFPGSGQRGIRPSQESDPMQVVVYTRRDRASAWWSTRSSTSSRTRSRCDRLGRRQGLIGSAVIQQRVTDVLDVPGLIRTVDPDLVTSPIGEGD